MAKNTKQKAIMELACAVAGEDVSRRYGKRTTDAIDALADAIAGEDVRSRETITEALGALDGPVSGLAGGVAALRAALEGAGIDTGGGSLAEVLAAAAGCVDETDGDGGWAGDSDIDELFEGGARDPGDDPEVDGMFN